VNETKFDTEKIRQPNASQKAFELLKCVAASQSEITLSDLARQLGFSKDTTHGMIQALLQAGALEQGPNRKGFFPEIVAQTGRAAVRLRESLDRRSQDES
jgi:DNA-binding IclR family transcriptional regulator